MQNLTRMSGVVHTRDGRSLEGVVSGVYRDCLVLSHASYLLENGQKEPMSGEIVLPRDNVSFIQAVEQ
jgi:hypothetical protein